MRIDYFVTFIAVAECGSVSQAAKRLCYSQPTVSRQLHLLESRVGAPLFFRESRPLRMTATGLEMLKVAKDVVEATDSLLRLGVEPDLMAWAAERLDVGRFDAGVDGPSAPSRNSAV